MKIAVTYDNGEIFQDLVEGKLDYNPDVHCSHHDHEEGHSRGDHGCGNHSCHS